MNRIDRNTEETIRRFLALIASRYDVATAIVYGSRARGTHHSDSDVDVAVRVPVQLDVLTKPAATSAIFSLRRTAFTFATGA
ncbi:MAG: hypothetical protein NVS3B3_21170 [Aquirhabdus sp.]